MSKEYINYTKTYCDICEKQYKPTSSDIGVSTLLCKIRTRLFKGYRYICDHGYDVPDICRGCKKAFSEFVRERQKQ